MVRSAPQRRTAIQIPCLGQWAKGRRLENLEENTENGIVWPTQNCIDAVDPQHADGSFSPLRWMFQHVFFFFFFGFESCWNLVNHYELSLNEKMQLQVAQVAQIKFKPTPTAFGSASGTLMRRLPPHKAFEVKLADEAIGEDLGWWRNWRIFFCGHDWFIVVWSSNYLWLDMFKKVRSLGQAVICFLDRCLKLQEDAAFEGASFSDSTSSMAHKDKKQ